MRFLLAASIAAALVFVPTASASSCPGSADPCPWTQFDSFGDPGVNEFRSPYGIGADAAGNVYVLDGDTHRVQKFDSAGAFIKTWGDEGSGDGQFGDAYDIAVDPVGGGVYVADNGSYRVEKFDTDGKFVSAWGWGVADGSAAYQVCTSGCRAGIGGSGAGQFSSILGVATDGANVYVADSKNKRIQKYDLAGNPAGSWSVPGGQAPKRLTLYGGKVYVTTTANAVWRFSTAGVPDSSWDGDGVMGSTGSGAGQFQDVQAITVDATGAYVADAGNDRVQKLDSSGSPAGSWGSTGSGDGQLHQPFGIVSTGGSVWVAEWGNYRIQKFSQAGVHQATVGAPLGVGDYYWPADVTTTPSGAIFVADGDYDIERLDASGTAMARWSVPADVNGIVGTAGGVYVGGPGNHVTKYDETGALVDQFGTTGSGLGQFLVPYGLTVGADGNLYVADTNNSRVQKISSAGAPLATFGSPGPAPGQLSAPTDVALDSDGNVYIANRFNDRIDKFSPTGVFLTAWGGTGSGDGQLRSPVGVVVDRAGHVFVSDAHNDRIQEFDLNGKFIARWGALGAGPGEISNPTGLTIAADGAIWVADNENHRIVRFCCPAAKGGPAIGGTEPEKPVDPPSDPGDGPGGAPDTTAPRIALGGRTSQRTRMVRRRGLALSVSTNERATVTLRAVIAKRTARRLGLRATTIGRATASLSGAGTNRVQLRLSARARRALSRQPRVRIVVRATAADPAGNRSTTSRAISARR